MLGADGEEIVAELDRQAERQAEAGAGSASSSSDLAPSGGSGHAEAAGDVPDPPAPVGSKGPDQGPRTRRTWRESGAGPANTHD